MIINIGSINLDHVYRVHHLAAPGETITSLDYTVLGGGKGANQSLALAKAGAEVMHLGKIGKDGIWLKEELEASGVDVSGVSVSPAGASGHAVIQVDAEGMNSIVIFGGANRELDLRAIEKKLDEVAPATVLLQNETNDVGALIDIAHRSKHRVVLNPAPMTDDVKSYPLHAVDILVVNELEASELCGSSEPEMLRASCPNAEVVVTKGARGVSAWVASERVDVPAFAVKAVDTVAAGDCFVGYLLASLDRGIGWEEALGFACAGAAVSVGKRGAMASIPSRYEVEAFLAEHRR